MAKVKFDVNGEGDLCVSGSAGTSDTSENVIKFVEELHPSFGDIVQVTTNSDWSRRGGKRWFKLEVIEELAANLLVMCEQIREKREDV